MALVKRGEEIEFFALFTAGEERIADIGEEPVDFHVRSEDAGRLVLGGEEAVAPERRADDDLVARPQHDVTGEVLVLGAEPVEEPRTEGRTDRLEIAGVHGQKRGLMVRHVGVHRADDAAIVDDLGEIRESFVDFDTALAAFAEGERRGHEAGAFGLFVEFAVGLLALVLGERGLGIEGVDMRRAAVEEEKDEAFGAWGKMGQVRGGGGRAWRRREGGARTEEDCARPR